MVTGLRSATHDQQMSLLPTGCCGSPAEFDLLSHLRLFQIISLKRVCSYVLSG